MDASDKVLLSWASSRSSSIPKVSRTGESDENEPIDNHMSSKTQIRKEPHRKHFMSPTISASSKASRKKVLAERNQEFSTFPETLQGLHHHTSNADSKTPFVMRVSESDDEGQNSSSKPYDPFTNYLSPRPKFLRYKPNRRREILMGQENDLSREEQGDFDPQKATEDAESSHDVQCPTSPRPPQKLEEPENLDIEDDDDVEEEEEDDDDEEFEGLEEKSCFSLRGVMKLLLMLGFMSFSVMYICSMNSSTPSPAIQALWDLQHEYQKVHTHMFGGGFRFSGKWEGVASGTEDVYEEVTRGENHNMGQEVAVEELKEVVDVGIEENTVFGQESDVCEMGDSSAIGEDAKVVQDEGTSGFIYEEEEEATENHEAVQDYETLSVDHNLEIIEVGSDEKKGVEASETELQAETFQEFAEKVVDDTAAMSEAKENPEVEASETEKQSEPCEDFAEVVEDGIAAMSEAIPIPVEAAEVVEEIELFQDSEIPLSSANEVFPQAEVAREEIVPGSVEEPKKEVVESKMGLENEVSATSMSLEAAIGGVCIVLVAIASSIWALCKKAVSSQKHSSTPEKQPVAEEITVPASEPLLVAEPFENLESFVHRSSSIQSMDDGASTDIYQSRLAPNVQLLAEFEVGEVRSSLRSCSSSRNSNMMIGIEMNSEFAFQENKMKSHSKANETASVQPVQLSASEISSPPSYGSFTAEKKVVKKEEGKVATTPVRRSSRIRNRSVMSP